LFFGRPLQVTVRPNATRPLYVLSCMLCLSCLSVTLVYCGQTVGWIKMPLGTEVSLCAGHIVLDGDPAPPTERGTAAPPPLFGRCLLWPNGRPFQQLLSFCLSQACTEEGHNHLLQHLRFNDRFPGGSSSFLPRNAAMLARSWES